MTIPVLALSWGTVVVILATPRTRVTPRRRSLVRSVTVDNIEEPFWADVFNVFVKRHRLKKHKTIYFSAI